MKNLLSTLFFLISLSVGFAQAPKTVEDHQGKNYTNKYFISTNSGIQETPIGLRIGFLDKRGGYIATRFGKGYNYESDALNNVVATEGTTVSVTAGFILPVYYRESNFKAHTFFGIGYGHWFNRPPKNSTTTGPEFESGLMFSYHKLMISLGVCALVGDGNSTKGDLTVGIGYKF